MRHRIGGLLGQAEVDLTRRGQVALLSSDDCERKLRTVGSGIQRAGLREHRLKQLLGFAVSGRRGQQNLSSAR